MSIRSGLATTHLFLIRLLITRHEDEGKIRQTIRVLRDFITR